MKARRTKAREAALQVLYRVDLADGSAIESLEAVASELKLSAEVIAYAEAVITGVTENLADIDSAITEFSSNWAIERMPVVDRNVLRIAVFELLFRSDIPFKVVIDEAVELAKRFGSEDSGAFINGVLDPLASDRLSKASGRPLRNPA